MPYWKIIEKSPNRIVTQSDLSRKQNIISNCVYFAIACIPGILAIWMGIPVLPNKTICEPIGKNLVECRKVQSFLNVPINTKVTRQQQNLTRAVESPMVSGSSTLVWIGIGYIGGLIFLVVLFSSYVIIKIVCTFDRGSATVKIRKSTSINTATNTYHRNEINDLVLKVTDLLIDSDPSYIFIDLYLQSNRQQTIYDEECESFANSITSIICPICEILNLSWRLNISSKFGSFSFNFSEKEIEIDERGKTVKIPFQDISGLDIDTLSNGRHVVPSSDTSNNSYIHYEYIYKINLITQQNRKISLMEIEGREAIGRRSSEKSLPTNDNRAYKLSRQIETQLNSFIC